MHPEDATIAASRSPNFEERGNQNLDQQEG